MGIFFAEVRVRGEAASRGVPLDNPPWLAGRYSVATKRSGIAGRAVQIAIAALGGGIDGVFLGTSRPGETRSHHEPRKPPRQLHATPRFHAMRSAELDDARFSGACMCGTLARCS